MRRVLVAVLVARAGAAHGEASVEVMLNQQGQDLAVDLGLSVPELIAHAEERIDELYRVARLDQLLRSFGNAAAFSQRGLGVDYDVDPGDVMFGMTAAGIHGDTAIGTTNKLLGGSFFNFAGMVGVNLGRWQKPRWSVFGGGFYQKTTIHGLEGHLLTMGAHVQYQLVPATRPGGARWTGVAATTGLEYARWTIGTASSLESHFTAQGPAEHATVHMSSTGTLDVLSSIVTVPLEVTTGVRFGNTLVFYGGGGLALTTGDSSITADLDSLLTINSDRLPVGTAHIVGSGSNTPSAASVHALIGTAIHTRHARVFLQGAFSSGELAASLGLRMAL